MAFLENILGASAVAKFQDVQLDASVRENHAIEGTLTTHPIEEGSDINDHYRVEPRSITIEGEISNTPIAVKYPTQTAINSIRALDEGDKEPVQAAFKEFERMMEEVEVITIVTSLRTYENMVITNFTPTRTRETIGLLSFTATAEEAQFVSTLTGKAIELPELERTQKKKSKGKQPNKNANSEQAKKTSLAAKALDGLAGFF